MVVCGGQEMVSESLQLSPAGRGNSSYGQEQPKLLSSEQFLQFFSVFVWAIFFLLFELWGGLTVLNLESSCVINFLARQWNGQIWG